MFMRRAFVVSVLVAAAGTAAWAAPVRKAGQWQTTINGGQPVFVCLTEDMPMDEQSIMQSMSKIPGAECKMTKFTTSGDTTDYTMECTMNGSKMTSNGTITVSDPDTFTTKSHSHGGAVPGPNGQTMPMPDMDMTIAFHRTGPCKPGDRQIGK